MKCFPVFLVLFFAAIHPSFSQLYKDGDIIFIKNVSTKGKSLLPNGKSKYNFAGIIFIEKDGPTVYYSGEPFAKCSLPAFVNLSENKEFQIKHLTDEEMLSAKIVVAMHDYAVAKMGTSYDNQLNLNNEALYNAEFIWKIYQSALNLPLCIPREIKDYKVENPAALDFLKDAYGDEKLNEKIVAIGDIYQSQFLE